MTELEAEALAARLTRIWEPRHIEWKIGSDSTEYLRLNAVVAESLELSVHGSHTESLRFELADDTGVGFDADEHGDLELYPDYYVQSPRHALLQSQFVKRWLPYFRCGCWLSGCPIEASAHEKAQWIQGFTREEVEAWSLSL